jgi:hypothetical protein
MAKAKTDIVIKKCLCTEHEERILSSIRDCVHSLSPQRISFLVSIEHVTYKAVVGRRKDRQIILNLIESKQMLPLFEETKTK